MAILALGMACATSTFAQSGGGESLFAVEKQKRWKPIKGNWIWDGTKLTGLGPGTVEYKGSYQPPFVAKFSWSPRAGIRNGVYFANEVMMLNAPYAQQIGIKGMDPTKYFPFEFGRTYRCAIVVARNRSELYVDGKLVGAGAGYEKRVEKIEIICGDDWSPGTLEIDDFMLIRGTDKVPSG